MDNDRTETEVPEVETSTEMDEGVKYYRRLIENNDNEGERWNWWLYTGNGNESAINALKSFLERVGLDEEYEITDDLVSERDVNVLVKYGGSGYTSYHNKVDGQFVLPDPDEGEEQKGEKSDEDLRDFWMEALYKGGIKELFKEE